MEPTQRTPKPRLPLAIGLLLIAAGIALLVLFTRDPKGALPGMPNAWKGGPMLLGAGFCSIVGAFLIVLRRFSLAGFLVGGVVSAGLSAAATAYMQSIRDVTAVPLSIPISEAEQPEFIRLVKERVTAQRLTGLLNRLYATGNFSSPWDFETVSIRFGASSANAEMLTITLEYESSPYLHANHEPIHDIATNYAELTIAVTLFETTNINRFQGLHISDHVDQLCLTTYWAGDFDLPPPRRKRIDQLKSCIKLLEIFERGETEATIARAIKSSQEDYELEVRSISAAP